MHTKEAAPCCLQVTYNDDASYNISSTLSEVVFTAEADTVYYVLLLTSSDSGTCGKVDLRFSAVLPGGVAHQPAFAIACLHQCDAFMKLGV